MFVQPSSDLQILLQVATSIIIKPNFYTQYPTETEHNK